MYLWYVLEWPRGCLVQEVLIPVPVDPGAVHRSHARTQTVNHVNSTESLPAQNLLVPLTWVENFG